jgi:hypothetical protein
VKSVGMLFQVCQSIQPFPQRNAVFGEWIHRSLIFVSLSLGLSLDLRFEIWRSFLISEARKHSDPISCMMSEYWMKCSNDFYTGDMFGNWWYDSLLCHMMIF